MYFNQIEDVYKHNSYRYFKTFFHSLLPREFEIDQKDIEKLAKVRDDHLKAAGKAGVNDAFVKIV